MEKLFYLICTPGPNRRYVKAMQVYVTKPLTLIYWYHVYFTLFVKIRPSSQFDKTCLNIMFANKGLSTWSEARCDIRLLFDLTRTADK
jgi:hypothetical protein